MQMMWIVQWFWCYSKYTQDESDLGHPMSLLLIGCNKVLGLLVMIYLAYRSFFITSNVTKDLNIPCHSLSHQSSPNCQPLVYNFQLSGSVCTCSPCTTTNCGSLRLWWVQTIQISTQTHFLIRRWNDIYHLGRSRDSTTPISSRYNPISTYRCKM